jgi:hypothetical protein
VSYFVDDRTGEHEERNPSNAANCDRYPHERTRCPQILQQPEEETFDVAPSGS